MLGGGAAEGEVGFGSGRFFASFGRAGAAGGAAGGAVVVPAAAAPDEPASGGLSGGVEPVGGGSAGALDAVGEVGVEGEVGSGLGA